MNMPSQNVNINLQFVCNLRLVVEHGVLVLHVFGTSNARVALQQPSVIGSTGGTVRSTSKS